MKELKDVLKIVAEGLKTFSGSMGVLAGMIDEVASKIKIDEPAGEKTAEKPETPKSSVNKTKKSPAKKTGARPAKKPDSSAMPKTRSTMTGTAAEVVLDLLKQAEEGLNTSEIMTRTGYDKKKISNIFYRLKKRGDIRPGAKGTYHCNPMPEEVQAK